MDPDPDPELDPDPDPELELEQELELELELELDVGGQRSGLVGKTDSSVLELLNFSPGKISDYALAISTTLIN